jgi:hypothetical protein
LDSERNYERVRNFTEDDGNITAMAGEEGGNLSVVGGNHGHDRRSDYSG